MNKPVAIVLAGGVGKRFWPIETDKSLLPFLGRPLIEHTIQSLNHEKIERILVVANEANKKDIGRIKPRSGRITIVVQEKPMGMADALRTAKKEIGGKAILVINGADRVDQSLYHDVLTKSEMGSERVIIPGREHGQHFQGGYLRVRNERVLEIVEKPEAGSEPSTLVNLVVHYFRNADDLLTEIEKVKSETDDVYEHAVSRLLENGGAGLVRYKGPFGFVKYPWDILEMARLFLSSLKEKRVSKKAVIHPKATIEGPVVIGDNVSVLEQAVIKGPAYIGNSSSIGTNCLVLESIIGENTVVGFSSEITRSYIGDGCWLHQNYIGDTILEGENYFGAGAVTANFRFDAGAIASKVASENVNTGRKKLGAIVGRGARVGVNASLMPGIKIGGKALVGPGVTVYRDVPREAKLFERQERPQP
ncbi:MAG: hypothetical protein A3F04_01885 [Candidatus Chisholmbacteria bacterium RIFCSPHIGHO2_12_FULL_49_9]|nr:MAG: hypothetical protein A3F04_01885 [Candidatus Chisholmbacteria bacterium RIFCSPHIGHO2_12_FULL_49_9]